MSSLFWYDKSLKIPGIKQELFRSSFSLVVGELNDSRDNETKLILEILSV